MCRDDVGRDDPILLIVGFDSKFAFENCKLVHVIRVEVEDNSNANL